MPRSSTSSLTRLSVLGVGLALVVLTTGCSRSRAMDRSKLLEAEVINHRQQNQALQAQLRDAHEGTDVQSAQMQQMQADLLRAQEDARQADQALAQAAEARGRIVTLQDRVRARESELADLNGRYEKLLIESRNRPAAQPQSTAGMGGPSVRPYGGVSPQAEAMRRDLEQQLASYGIRDLNVEIRREGQQERVAIVLPDAFRAGKATLAYNPDAVKAVVGVGKMIREHYPNSRILVEGHTDSDPIRRSPWGTNENLSRARAKAVESLLTNAGIPAANVMTDGLGARQPLALGSSKAAKSRNRRVEIFITPGA